MRNVKRLFLGFVAAIACALTVIAEEPSQAQLTKQAKITKSQAEQIALAQVPHGKIQSAEIENEKGRLIWSFDIAKPHVKEITEIQVDAKTGRIISTQVESARDQAREAAADKKK